MKLIRKLLLMMGAGETLPYLPDFDLDASRLGLANNDPVASFTDFAAGGNHAVQADANLQPVFIASSANLLSLPVVRFDGVNDVMFTPSFLDAATNKALTWFAVVAGRPTSGTRVYMSNGVKFYGGREVWQNISAFPSLSTLKIGYSKQTSYASGYANWIDGSTYDGVRHLSMSNGNAKTGAMTANIGTTGALTVGGYNAGTLLFAWDIARILVWKKAFTLAEMQQAARVLAARYQTRQCVRRLIFVGDSLTSGYYGTAPGGSYPEQLTALMGSSGDYCFNMGVGGYKLSTDMSTEAAATVDLVHVSGVPEVFFVWGGTNDIHVGIVDGATLYTNFKTYCANRITAGASNVVIKTILPRSDGGNDVNFETNRQTFNAGLRADFTVATADPRVWLPGAGGTYASVLSDVAADNRIGDAGDELSAYYKSGDKCHMVDAGYAIIAEIDKLAMAAIGIT